MGFYSLLIPVSLALSWMLSPDALILQGNGAGLYGNTFYLMLTIGFLLAIGSISLFRHRALGSYAGNAFLCLTETTGIFPAATLILAGRASLVLFLPTGILVTAGFTFNEIFLYWFPNFAFSFSLLIFVLLLHLLGEKTALTIQPVLIGIAFSGLLFLSLYGLNGHHMSQPEQPALSVPNVLSIPAGALLLFLGFDFKPTRYAIPPNPGQLTLQPHRKNSDKGWNHLFLAPVSGYVLFMLWTRVSLDNVEAVRLSISTIPYLFVARESLGQTGRIIIGITVISGTLACVNGLFIQTNNILTELSSVLFHRFSISPAVRTRIYPIFFSVLIGIFMMTGMAGSEKLEIYIRGSLLLWLSLIIMQCFSVAKIIEKTHRYISTAGYALGIVLFLSLCSLLLSFHEKYSLLVFCSTVLITAALAAKGLLPAGNKHN
ncbi:hypothetical protein [Desulfomarina sp.]